MAEPANTDAALSKLITELEQLYVNAYRDHEARGGFEVTDGALWTKQIDAKRAELKAAIQTLADTRVAEAREAGREEVLKYMTAKEIGDIVLRQTAVIESLLSAQLAPPNYKEK